MALAMKQFLCVLALSMAVAFASSMWEESATAEDSLLAYTSGGSAFQGRSSESVQPIDEENLMQSILEDAAAAGVESAGCAPTFTCGESGTENCCKTATATTVTAKSKLVHAADVVKAAADAVADGGDLSKVASAALTAGVKKPSKEENLDAAGKGATAATAATAKAAAKAKATGLPATAVDATAAKPVPFMDTAAGRLAGIGDKRRAAAKVVAAAATAKAAAANATAAKGGNSTAAAAFNSALKKFGLAPGSHLSGKAKPELGAASRRRYQRPLIPPAVSSDASLGTNGAYHLGHNRRRIGAGFAHERKKGWKNVQPPHGKLPKMLRKEFPKIWYRKKGSSKYTQNVTVKDLFPNRTYYKGAGHRGVFPLKKKGKKKGKSRGKKAPGMPAKAKLMSKKQAKKALKNIFKPVKAAKKAAKAKKADKKADKKAAKKANKKAKVAAYDSFAVTAEKKAKIWAKKKVTEHLKDHTDHVEAETKKKVEATDLVQDYNDYNVDY